MVGIMTDLEEYVDVEVPEHFPAEWAKGDDRPARDDGVWRLRIVHKGKVWHTIPMRRDEAQHSVNCWRARLGLRFDLMSGDVLLWSAKYKRIKLMEVVE